MIADHTALPAVTDAQECPVNNQRKVTPQTDHPHKAIEVDAEGIWHIHGYDETRQILRSDLVKQAGFNSEVVIDKTQNILKNQPILFLDGEEHHRMRRETNKFFTPSITDKQYRDFMHNFADEQVETLKRKRRANLNELTMDMALSVAGRVVGLTSSIVPGLSSRLNGVLDMAKTDLKESPNPIRLLFAQRYMLAFLWLDVKPAIRARRKNPQNDVISYLISRDYSDLEILTECVVYGVAGMVTTREFICVALWHLLDNPHLRQRMLVGSQEERYAILHEILRLEPVIGHLYRRTTAALAIESEGHSVTIPAGTLIDLNIYTTNIDPHMAGENAAAVCPVRPLNSALGKVPEYVMSFGDGAHRCPGAYLAIQESDILLVKLLQLETLRIEKKPDVAFNPSVNSYELFNFPVTLD
ncbi:MAG: cytochrome P450 [Burkholderiales bacterium]|nr:cytochrome P450 [Anaerolineae bacterium]